MSYIAHIREQDAQEQPLKKHLEETAQLSSKFARAFGASETAYFCGLLHDIGKYSKQFQERIRGANIHVDHSTAGMLEALKAGDPFSAFAIAGHHGGLPDGGNRKADQAESPTLSGRMKRQVGKDIYDYSAYTEEIKVPNPKLPDYLGKSGFRDAFFARMLFSALVDADYLNTECFMSCGAVQRGSYETVERMLEKLESFILRWQNPQSLLDKKRSEILRQCLKSADNPKGLYTLTVPTGGGKTVSSLAFALRHANVNGMNRVIYVIPYTNIIEQTADVFSKIVGPENVLEHHARIDYDADENSDDAISQKKRLSTENWDAPLIVTTSVQFFESLFSNKPSRCRKLHNIAGSVLIFDEAQMLPVPYLKPCVAALSELVTRYGCTVVLCTATQPALDGLFREINPNLKITEICDISAVRDRVFQRARYEHAGELTYDELARRLNTYRQALCVVNSRAEAQDIFSKLEPDGRFHLSTLMTPFDRKAQLDAIRQRLKSGETCRVVSTSLIEAGVDLDFPTVFRAEAGLDSIIQAAGRCNREGKKTADDSVVYVFQAERPVPKLFEQNAAVARTVMREFSDFGAPEAVKRYFEQLHYIKGDALDQKKLMDAHERGSDGGFLPFEAIARLFRLIENDTRTVYIPNGPGAEYVQRFLEGERTRALFRKAGMFGVELYKREFEALLDLGVVQKLDESVSILSDQSLYSNETGLIINVETGKALFT